MKCAGCDLRFVPSVRADRRNHDREHDSYLEAVTALRYLPMTHGEQEQQKRCGSAQMLQARTLRQQVDAALTILRARYDRSLQVAMKAGYWRAHPKFHAYVAMCSEWGDIPAEAWDALHARYGRQEGQIAPGYSYWVPLKRSGGRPRSVK